MLNLLPFSSADMSVKSHISLGEIFVIFINSKLSAKPFFFTFLIPLSTYGSSNSPVPPTHPLCVVVYSGSGPLISSSFTANGLINHRSNSSRSSNGIQHIHRILTIGGTYSSKRLQTPSLSSSSGKSLTSRGLVPQSVSLVSFHPSLSSSKSSIKLNTQFDEFVRYLQVNESGIESLSVSNHAVGFFGNLSIKSPILSPSSSSSM